MNYDVIIVGAGPGGIFAAYELKMKRPELKVGVFEAGYALSKRRCPIDGEKVKSCIGCKTCSIMSGFGGASFFVHLGILRRASVNRKIYNLCNYIRFCTDLQYFFCFLPGL